MKTLMLTILAVCFSVATARGGGCSYYCYFQDEPVLTGYFTDAFYCGGPFRVNGSVILHSSTPHRDSYSWFYSFTLSSDYFIYGSPSGPGISVPHYEKLWIEPYEMMELGPPWFNLGVDPLPFGSDQVSVQTSQYSDPVVYSLTDFDEQRLYSRGHWLKRREFINATGKILDGGL